MAKKEIVNVIEVINEVVSGVNSFVIKDKKSKQKTVTKAEKLFTQLALDNGLADEEIEAAIEDGTYSDGNGYVVCLTWSN